MRVKRSLTLTAIFTVAPFLALPAVADTQMVANPLCPAETVLFNPDQGQDIVLPTGFKVSVFASV